MPRPMVAIVLPPQEAQEVGELLAADGYEVVQIAPETDPAPILAGQPLIGVVVLNARGWPGGLWALLRRIGPAVRPLAMVSSEAQARKLRSRRFFAGEAIIVRPYSPDTLRWRIEAMLIKLEVASVPGMEAILPALFEEPSAESDRHGRLIVVFNPKGGVGKTTVAINLGAVLAMRRHQRVLLIDGDTVTGHITESLGMSDVPNASHCWASALAGWPAPSFAQCASRHSEGLAVLPLSDSPLHTENLAPEAVVEAISKARASYDWVICDTHPNYGALNQAILAAADRIIVPVTPDIPSVRAALYFVRMAKEVGIWDRLLIVPNRANSGVAIEDLERTLGLPAFGRIRSAGMLFTTSTNAGRALVEQYPGSGAAADLERLTDKLMAQIDPALGRAASSGRSWVALGRRIFWHKVMSSGATRQVSPDSD